MAEVGVPSSFSDEEEGGRGCYTCCFLHLWGWLQLWIRSHAIGVGVEMVVRTSSDEEDEALAEEADQAAQAEEQVQVSAEVPSGLPCQIPIPNGLGTGTRTKLSLLLPSCPTKTTQCPTEMKTITLKTLSFK